MRNIPTLLGCFICFVGGTLNGLSHLGTTLIGLVLFFFGTFLANLNKRLDS